MTTPDPHPRAPIVGDEYVATRRPSVERRHRQTRDQLVERVIAEFREMPCLRLTPAQAQRLFGLRSDISTRVISKLVLDGELRIDSDGRVVRGD